MGRIASDCKSRGKVCETKQTATTPSAGSGTPPRHRAPVAPRRLPFRLFGMGVSPEGFQSTEMAFFKAIYSPGAPGALVRPSHRSALRGAKGAQVNRFRMIR